jgi:hypothetical protein
MKKPDPTKVIELDPPITVPGGGTFTELTLGEPKAIHVLNAEKHLKGAAIGAVDIRMYQLTLVSQQTGIPFATLRDNFPISVLNEAARYLQDFVEAGQPTGEDASSS